MPEMLKRPESNVAAPSEADGRKAMPDTHWRTLLSPQQYATLREGKTDPAYAGSFVTDPKAFPAAGGSFVCAACATPLYRAEHRQFPSCGWLSFSNCLPKAVREVGVDDEVAARAQKLEIICNACGGHLGHVFRKRLVPEKDKTNERFCQNLSGVVFVSDDGAVRIDPTRQPASATRKSEQQQQQQQEEFE